MNHPHPAYWEYASSKASPLPDVIADLVGPDVKFHHSKLNFKWSKGGDVVKWHQDICSGRTPTTVPARPERTFSIAIPSRAPSEFYPQSAPVKVHGCNRARRAGALGVS